MKHIIKILLLFFLFTINACSKKSQEEPSRTFFMGVTPWPADFTAGEVDNAYSFINNHCDLVSHHFDEGIPYEEAYNNKGWPAALVADINTRKTKTAAGKKILLSSSALALNRKQKASYSSFSQTINATVKSQWEALPVNDPKVVTAYSNYIIYLAENFNPSYINYGVESNNNEWNSTDFALYKDFLSQVFIKIKAAYPAIPVMISLMVNETVESLSFATQLLPYTDYIALSAYPYTLVSSSVNGNTNPALFPADYFTRYIQLDSGKPLCFAETAYIAEPLVLSSFGLNKQGNEQWQDDYLQKVLNLLNERKGKFIIWFCHKDYDAGNNTLRNMGLYQELFSFWEDTGLIDENNRTRFSYNTWLTWMQRKITP
jgi:hypothetical protein